MLYSQEEQSKEEKAVLLEIVELIKELQNLPFLESFNLGGGTALALQFDHRTSEDIDLMSSIKFSSQEMMKIKESLISHFNERIIKI